LVEPLAGTAVALLSAGSDGIDGPTDAAGAFADGRTLERAQALGLDPQAALADNDSYGFFAPLGDLLRCGATGTNVMDIKVAVGLPSAH
jgi:hydroxypyruvate reductase